MPEWGDMLAASLLPPPGITICSSWARLEAGPGPGGGGGEGGAVHGGAAPGEDHRLAGGRGA